MVNELIRFLQNNTPQMIIGVAVGVIVAILGDFSIAEGLTIIVIAPLIAFVLNQLLKTFVPNERNQRNASIIIIVVGLFFLAQQFNIGFFSVENIDFQTAIQPQAVSGLTLPVDLIKGLPKAGIFTIIGTIFLVFTRIPVVGVWLAPVFIIAMIILFGVPFVGLSIAIFKNFQLVLILGALALIASFLFKAKFAKR